MPVTATEVGLVSADAETLVSFYVGAFGFVRAHRLEFAEGVVHRLVADGGRLKVFEPRPAPRARVHPAPWHAESGFAYAALHVTEIAAVVDRAVGAGADVRVPVTNHRPGAWFALLADPEGNLWEVLEEA